MISKLRHDAALSMPYDGPYAGRGKRKKYGKKLDYRHIPAAYLKESFVEKDIETKIYQMHLWHKNFADLLNIVVMVKTNLKTQAVAHVVLFSSDLDLSYEQLIDYYPRLLCFGWWLMDFGLAWKSTRRTPPITASRQHAPRAVVVWMPRWFRSAFWLPPWLGGVTPRSRS